MSSNELEGIDVLVVDDDDDEREMLSFVLSLSGARVSAVASARAALAACREARPNVIVCDISLPEQDGYSLIRELRSSSDSDGAPIAAVALTGWSTESDRVRAIEAGFQVHFGKPVDIDTLLSVVSALARHGLAHDVRLRDASAC